jgi:hypothetical protein
MQSTEPTIEIAQPRLFTLGAAVIVNAYGLLLVAPLFASILIVSVIPIGPLTLVIPILVVAASAFFLPFGLGNTHITRLVRSQNSVANPSGEGFIVQLTLWPRLRSGLQATLEDADDIGYLSFSEMGLLFQGDSVRLSVPFERIALVKPHNVGLRGRFVYGRRIKVVVTGLPNVEFIEFAERSSWLLPNSRATTKRLFQCLSAKASPEKLTCS